MYKECLLYNMEDMLCDTMDGDMPEYLKIWKVNHVLSFVFMVKIKNKQIKKMK